MPIQCDICEKVLSNNFALKRHMDMKHQDNEETHDTGEPETQSSTKDEDQDVSVDEESEDEEEYWRFAMLKAYERMPNSPTDPVELLLPSKFESFIVALRDYDDEFKTLENSRNESGLTIAIENTKEFYEEKMQLDEDEAIDMAWEARKFKIKKFIKENIDVFEEADKEGSEKEEKEEEPLYGSGYYYQYKRN